MAFLLIKVECASESAAQFDFSSCCTEARNWTPKVYKPRLTVERQEQPAVTCSKKLDRSAFIAVHTEGPMRTRAIHTLVGLAHTLDLYEASSNERLKRRFWLSQLS